MQLLWIILRWLFPNDPVQQCIGAARHRIALMASQVFTPQSLFLLAHDPQARLHIEALIIDYEAALHMAIGARACQIAKMRFRFHLKAFYRPTRALSRSSPRPHPRPRHDVQQHRTPRANPRRTPQA